MMFLSITIILIVSFFLAIRSVNRELSVPEEVKNIKIVKKIKGFSGVILFLKEKIIHYSSTSS